MKVAVQSAPLQVVAVAEVSQMEPGRGQAKALVRQRGMERRVMQRMMRGGEGEGARHRSPPPLHPPPQR